MSLIFATQLTAIATAVLATFAIVTAVFAFLAFRKQSDAVRDGREMIGQQKDMLEVQSNRLETYRHQVDEQRQVYAAWVETLELEAREIRASLEQRKNAAEQERRSQAEKVTAWFGEERHGIWGAHIRNGSGLPVIDVRVFFYYIAEKTPSGDWEPVPRGAPTKRIRIIPPQTDRFFPIPEQTMSMMDQVSDDIYAVGIWFTDAAGNRWERDARGALLPRS
jgi:hypothetical protein